MPQYVDDSFDYDDDVENSHESGAIREVRKALRAAEKRNKELAVEVEQFRAQARQGVLKQSLEARGLNPKIAAFVPAEASDDESIGKWLDEFGDVFGAVSNASSEEGQQSGAPAVQQRHQQTIMAGSAPTGDEAQLLSLIKGASTPAELSQIIHGNPNGPSF